MLTPLVLGPVHLPTSQLTPDDDTVSKSFGISVVNKYCVFNEYCVIIKKYISTRT